jgi:acetoin utilization protein AcuC
MHRLAHELCNGRLLLFGGGGYTLANVPRVWAVAFATLAGVEMSSEIPKDWSKEFESQTNEDPPASLYDEPTTDNQNIEKDVQRVLTELRSHLDR